jgi:hypothetical protein
MTDTDIIGKRIDLPAEAFRIVGLIMTSWNIPSR